MDIIFGHLTLIAAALFTGAALYVSFAEQPARLKLDDAALLAEWKPSYKRGFAMQAPLAFLGFLFGLLAWYDKGEGRFLWSSILMIANWPWTLVFMMPTNNKLMSLDPLEPDSQTRAIIQKWGTLHAVRTGLGIAATISFFTACTVP
jgi:hypothetical protein